MCASQGASTSAVIPVLLTERSSPGVFGVMDLTLDESLLDPARTVADLVRTLNDKLSSATQSDADVIHVINWYRTVTSTSKRVKQIRREAVVAAAEATGRDRP
jgi:hypothetical protein